MMSIEMQNLIISLSTDENVTYVSVVEDDYDSKVNIRISAYDESRGWPACDYGCTVNLRRMRIPSRVWIALKALQARMG